MEEKIKKQLIEVLTLELEFKGIDGGNARFSAEKMAEIYEKHAVGKKSSQMDLASIVFSDVIGRIPRILDGLNE